MTRAAVVFRHVEVDGRIVDVVIRDGVVQQLGADLPTDRGSEIVHGDGGALVPGLHDHHLHLAALAASLTSLRVGPPEVRGADAFAAVLRAAHLEDPPGRWLRAVGYHDSVAGALDRDALDRVVVDRPIRVQHRSGARWILNSAGLRAVGAETADHPGIERDASGRPTGSIDRADDWIAARTSSAGSPSAGASSGFPDLGAVGARLASVGVTGVTDCTPYLDGAGPAAIGEAVRSGSLPQAVVLTGDPRLDVAALPPSVAVGPAKVVLDEHDLPAVGDLVATVRSAHAWGRPVAMHLVTAAATAFAVAVWTEAGSMPGDRIEHGSVLSPAMIPVVARLGLTVVTQPGFVAERGDTYLAEVDARDVDDLYRCASLLDAGIPVGASTDAPFTDADPWRAIRAAVDRRTTSGAVLGSEERVAPRRALDLFLGEPGRPGHPRRVRVGVAADLCLLRCGLDAALADPDQSNVTATFRRGRRIDPGSASR